MCQILSPPQKKTTTTTTMQQIIFRTQQIFREIHTTIIEPLIKYLEGYEKGDNLVIYLALVKNRTHDYQCVKYIVTQHSKVH